MRAHENYLIEQITKPNLKSTYVNIRLAQLDNRLSLKTKQKGMTTEIKPTCEAKNNADANENKNDIKIQKEIKEQHTYENQENKTWRTTKQNANQWNANRSKHK